MRRLAIAVFLTLGTGRIGAQCVAPPEALAKLVANLRFTKSTEGDYPVDGRYTVLEIGRCAFFRFAPKPERINSEFPLVYIYVPGRMIGAHTDRDAADWVAWATAFLRDPLHFSTPPPCGADVAARPPCDLVLKVSPWEPSPNGPEKQRMAVDLLSEIRAHGDTDEREIYVRDFNMEDPDIWVYAVDRDGTRTVEGCYWNPAETPRCTGWHYFGQTPEAWLRREVMKRPYRLYPPPMGPLRPEVPK